MAGIKTQGLDPTRENIYKTLVADAVGRNKHLWQFCCFCSAQVGRCSIALDSGWGTGKTFFLKQLEMLFNCFDLEENKRKEIERVFSEFRNSDAIINKLKPHICIYYDAWLNDNAEDPMRSLLYCLIKHKSEQFLKQSKLNKKTKDEIKRFANNAKEFIKTLCRFNSKNNLLLDAIAPLENLIPLGLGKVTESIKALNPTHEIEAQKSFHDGFDDFLKSLVPNAGTRLLVLIDELDRCKPPYAVQLLERIKHYLSNDRVTFVFAMNEEQIQSTIKAFYGDDFDAHRYLDRFFDFRLSLPQADATKMNMIYGFNETNETNAIYFGLCRTIISEYHFSLREAEKYMYWVKLVCKSFDKDIRFEDKTEYHGWQFVIFILVPFVLGLNIHDSILLRKFLDGKTHDINPLRSIVEHCAIAQYFLYFPQNPFIFISHRTFDRDKTIHALSTLDNIYSILFVDKFSNGNFQHLGDFFFKKEMLETIHTASNFMADFIKYDTNTEETAHG